MTLRSSSVVPVFLLFLESCLEIDFRKRLDGILRSARCFSNYVKTAPFESHFHYWRKDGSPQVLNLASRLGAEAIQGCFWRANSEKCSMTGCIFVVKNFILGAPLIRSPSTNVLKHFKTSQQYTRLILRPCGKEYHICGGGCNFHSKSYHLLKTSFHFRNARVTGKIAYKSFIPSLP